MSVDVGKIFVDRAECVGLIFIILHACRTAIWQFLWFYAFYTRESAAACDCQRFLNHSRDSLQKEINFFSSRCFWATRVSVPTVNVPLPYRSVRPCACLLLEPFFLLSFLRYRGGSIFYSRPWRQFSSLLHWGYGYLTLIPILNLTLILDFI